MKIITRDDIDLTKQCTWKQKELEEFRDMVLKETELNSRTDDIFLLGFLRSRKYDKENALQLLRNYYSVRRHVKELKNLTPSALEHVLQENVMGYLCIDGEKFLGFGRASHWDTTKISAIDLGRCIMLYIDLALNIHSFQVNGVSIIVDAKTVSWRHVVQLTPRVVKLLVSCFYKTLPVSYKSIHFVNMNAYLLGIHAMFRPLIPKKIRQRVHVHGSNMEALHKEIDPKYLPVEFGGTLNSFDWSSPNQLIMENEEFYVENEKYWNN
ncbi:alpha-tocopherol transfer protein-like [Centruroides sculpturatus]|uniref:alpha-tocopherol transfer protein-like n=1 Tax=Centruroides sculpturatus TaxID=218467 RepID=UPI000C6D1A83|nr:alpha-tocopherol transfer protein-like [Centruroides sculpturatus]